MKSQIKVCLLGYSGHGMVIAEALNLIGYQNIYYAEQAEMHNNPFQLQYAGFEAERKFLWNEYALFVLGIGDNNLRAKVARKVQMQGKRLMSIKHPQSMIAAGTKVGKGSFVARGACISPLVTIGSGVIVNTGAVVEHECYIHDYAHIAPSATLAGNVTVLSGAFVGANAVVKQGIKIGRNAVIGAGSVVLQDVPNDITIAGNPAKPLNR